MTHDLRDLKMRYGIVGRSPGLDLALEHALVMAPTLLPVLIEAESGTGKESLARLVHDHSPRKHGPYIAVNCGSIPSGTIESELFGHVKGAFTGAIADHKGLFAAARGGTLFLDEVGELTLETQARLLRVLESGEFIAVGSTKAERTDARIVAATNRCLPERMHSGEFREDLFYRLSALRLSLPPLRERGDDILLLFRKFAREAEVSFKIPEPLELTPEAEDVLLHYDWPGNIREIRAMAQQLTLLSESRRLTREALLAALPAPRPTAVVWQDRSNASSDTDRQQVGETLRMMQYAIMELRRDVDLLKERIAPEAATPLLLTDKREEERQVVVDVDEPMTLADMERQAIERALQKHNGRRRLAAEELGISERTLYRKIQDYGME